MAVSDYPNGCAPRSELVFVENMWCSPDMAARVITAFKNIRARGATIAGTQGYRWLGAPDDRMIGRRDPSGNEALSASTSDGTANQWYQVGRMDEGYTPSAAMPDEDGDGTSDHGLGLSIDTDCSSIDVRDEEFALVGLKRNIPSETWHATIYRDPVITLDSLDTLTEDFLNELSNVEQREVHNAVIQTVQALPSLIALIKSLEPLIEAAKDTHVYAVLSGPSKNAWLALGPSIDYNIPPGKGDDWIARYGPLIEIEDAPLAELRRGFATGRK